MSLLLKGLPLFVSSWPVFFYYYWIHVCLWYWVMERGIVVLWCIRDRARRSAHSDRLCRFMQTCMWPLCVADCVGKSQGDARSGARWSFCCLHGVLRPGLPSKIASEAKAMNERRQRSPSSHLPPHYIAIRVESVDPQPDGGKSVHSDSVMALGSHNPSPATPCYAMKLKYFISHLDIFEFFDTLLDQSCCWKIT